MGWQPGAVSGHSELSAAWAGGGHECGAAGKGRLRGHPSGAAAGVSHR